MAQKELPIIFENTPLLCTCTDDIQFDINSYFVSDCFPKRKTDAGFLICAILNGGCVVEADGKRYELSDKHFAVIPAKCDYSLISVSELFLCFTLNFDFKSQMPKEGGFWTVVSDRLCEIGAYQLNDNIKSIISILKGEALQKKHDSESLSQIYLGTLFNEMARVIAEEYISQPKSTGYGDARIDAAINYINENISANITSSDVAKYVFLSEKQLKRIFTNAIGKTPTDYIKFCKYERARKLLKESEFSIFEIAELAGFHDIKSFAEFFKRYSGHSPAKYRALENN